MQSETLLGHLARRFSVHPENLATEALCFILRNSPSASRAFSELACEIGLNEPISLHFTKQQGGLEGSIPDMKCFDGEGRLRVIVENKFWADLTDNQPTTYIRELQPGVPALLMFVAPNARLQSLWHEVLDRYNKVAANRASEIQRSSSIRVADIGGGHYLAAISWSDLLNKLSQAAKSEEDSESDIIQLEGLCRRMDEEEFLPLTPEELTDPNMARRFLNFSNLSSAIAQEAAGWGLCKVVKEANFRHGSGVRIQIAGFTAWIGFDRLLWSHRDNSPIWVEFYRDLAKVRKGLDSFRRSRPPRCFDVNGGNGVAVPILLTAGVERQQVIKDAVQQLRQLKAELELSGPIDGVPDLPKDTELDATLDNDWAGYPSDGGDTDYAEE